MGRGGRVLLVMGVATLLVALLRAPLRSAGMGTVGLFIPLMMAVPWLVLGWYNAQVRRRPECPNDGLPLVYRRLGPSHGMLECPALCGYRKLVGDPGAAP